MEKILNFNKSSLKSLLDVIEKNNPNHESKSFLKSKLEELENKDNNFTVRIAFDYTTNFAPNALTRIYFEPKN